MKRYFICFLLFLVGFQSCSTAQHGRYSTNNNRAIKFYEEALQKNGKRDPETGRRMFGEVTKLLEKAIRKDEEFAEAHRFLGKVYAQSGKGEASIEEYEKALKYKPSLSTSTGYIHYEIASAGMEYGLYKPALKHVKIFLKKKRANQKYIPRARKIKKNASFAVEAKKNPSDYEPINLGSGVNTEVPEYFPTITADDQTLLFTRRVKDPDHPRGAQEDFFITHPNEDGTWETGYSISGTINTLFNEGAPSYNPDGKSLVFVACEDKTFARNPSVPFYGKNRSGYGSCDLFITEKRGDRWTPAKNLSDNVNTRYWESQPSVSADGNTIYFVRGKGRRKMGGYQEQDIYVTHKNQDGTWQEAEKLSKTINTRGREESVQIHPDGRTLYFTSNGHTGMGKLDIFMSRKQHDGSWNKPKNLGYPINTHKNENSLLVSSSGEIAFFASDRKGGFGNLDIYSFKMPKEFRPNYTSYMTGLVYDKKTKDPLQAQFELIDLASGELVVSSKSDAENGEFLVALPTGRDYALIVEKKGYNNYSKNFTLEKSEKNEPYEVEVPLVPIGKDLVKEDTIRLNNVFFDLDKATLRDKSHIELDKLAKYLKDNASMKIEIHGHTDNQGTDEYNKKLSQDRAKSVYNYLVKQKGIKAERLSSKGFGESLPVATNETEEGRQRNRRTEYVITDI